MNNASQTCKDESGHLELSAMKEQKKENLNSTENPSSWEKKRCFER